MKKLILILLISSFTSIINTGCNENPSVNNKFFLHNALLTVSRSLIDDTVDICALIVVTGTKYNEDIDTVREEAYAMTYFSNYDDFVNVSSSIVNDVQLLNIDNLTGQYGGVISYPKEEPHNIIWNVTGYLGNNLSDTFQVVKPLSFININFLDSINKNQSHTINYDGYSAGTLYVKISYQQLFTLYPDTLNDMIETIAFEVPDNGNFTITPDLLSSLPANQYYALSIEHRDYSTGIYNNNYFGKYSSFRTSISFFLIDN